MRDLVILLFYIAPVNLQITSIFIMGNVIISSNKGTNALDSQVIRKVPKSLELDTFFYRKYLDANGIPIVSSDKVSDEALVIARRIIIEMMSKDESIEKHLVANKVRVTIIDSEEKILDIPEYKTLQTDHPNINWDKRARGLGATLNIPVASASEENLLCYTSNVYCNENLLVHEFAHTIHLLALRYVDFYFDKKLYAAYKRAKRKGLWKNTYAISNPQEYFAEGVQCWYNVNVKAIPADGIHNHISSRGELENYDPKLYTLIEKYFSPGSIAICNQNNSWR